MYQDIKYKVSTAPRNILLYYSIVEFFGKETFKFEINVRIKISDRISEIYSRINKDLYDDTTRNTS